MFHICFQICISILNISPKRGACFKAPFYCFNKGWLDVKIVSITKCSFSLSSSEPGPVIMCTISVDFFLEIVFWCLIGMHGGIAVGCCSIGWLAMALVDYFQPFWGPLADILDPLPTRDLFSQKSPQIKKLSSKSCSKQTITLG